MGRKINHLFEAKYQSPEEPELNHTQLYARGQAVFNLTQTAAWEWVNEKVGLMLADRQAKLNVEKDEKNLRFLQGQVSGIAALREAIQEIVDDGDNAAHELLQRDGVTAEELEEMGVDTDAR